MCVCVFLSSVWLIVKMCLGTLGIAPQLHFLLPILKGIEILPASLVMKTSLFIEILAMDNDPFQSALYKTTIISTVVDINQPLSIVVDIKQPHIWIYTCQPSRIKLYFLVASIRLVVGRHCCPWKDRSAKNRQLPWKRNISQKECLLETFPNIIQVISGQITMIPYNS